MATLQSINCIDASSISFEISIPDIAEWEGSTDQIAWALNSMGGDGRCEPTFDQYNGVVSYTNINASVCGYLYVTPEQFQYHFFIGVSPIPGSATFPVTLAYDHFYAVGCYYNREQENIMASFEPRHILADSGSGKSKSINLNSNQLLCDIPASLPHYSTFLCGAPFNLYQGNFRNF